MIKNDIKEQSEGEQVSEKLAGLKIDLCQMNVVPGRPDLNAAYIAGEIRAAAGRGVDIIVFPELAVTGYFIGDVFENEGFLRDVSRWNDVIRQATSVGITAIVGTTALAVGKSGEDGWQRLGNAAVVYSNGRYINHVLKTLQPNYRIFDDDRHFYSTRKQALERRREPEDLLEPLTLKLKGNRVVRIGVMLCEDMWHEHYPVNPAKVLAEKGADILFNLSASPWTWQKNRKRHQVVEKLLQDCKVPFVYVNNSGIQNTGKNIVIFDGSSTVYNGHGQPAFQVPAYAQGSHDFVISDRMPALEKTEQDDAKELYQALKCGITEFFSALPPDRRRMLIGLSGGIDSALAAAMYVDALGKQNVIGVNMPSKFSSTKTRELARTLAENLGIAYEIKPIQDIVDTLAERTGVAEGSLAYENIQARVRMEILAGMAQERNCLFSANWNKVEAAFGYGTLYADMAGALAFEGDLIKREVYQVGDYLNRVVCGRPVIPEGIFTVKPSAELREKQSDPFDYGNLAGRGYHDEMVRAFTEFRREPEWFLQLYLACTLEKELILEPGRLKNLFPTSRHFIHDLEKHWRQFFGAYFKRIQGPPVLIVSRRAFGTDLRESMLSPHFTERYYELRAEILSREPARLVVYGSGCNPPCRHHRLIVQQLLGWFDRVVVVPSGNRAAKQSLKDVSPADRKEMVKLNFKGLDRVSVDGYDLDNEVFTPTYALDERLKAEYPDYQVWHAVGADLVDGGRTRESEIQSRWIKGSEIWDALNFAVMLRPGYQLVSEDLPSKSELIQMEGLPGSSTLARERIAKGEDVSLFLMPEVAEYIKERGLYGAPGKER